MLSNYQLLFITQNHSHTSNVVDGIYSLDLIPLKANKFPSFWICNNENHNESGEHWFALFFESPTRPSNFFCSLGRKPGDYSSRVVQSLFANGNGEYVCNVHRYQSELSQDCAYFCLWLTDLRCQGLPYTHCLSLLRPDDAHFNETLVTNYVIKHMQAVS